MKLDIKMLDTDKIKQDFPIFKLKVNKKPLIYLDNAASTQMPEVIIKKLSNYHEAMHSNIHRGVHYLSEKATLEYEQAREKIRKHLNAESTKEIIFTKGTTNGINLVAHGFGRKFINKGDEIIISHLEHHSNIVPWQILCEEKKAELKIIPIDDEGNLIFEDYTKLFSKKTKFVSLTHVSNAIGTINPIKKLIDYAHKFDVPVLIDGAQSAPHMSIDLRDLGCDFFVFSGHKMCGPTGIGILYGKEKLLEKMQPFEGGGDMILSVSFEKTTYNSLPYKFEAGTPPISQAIALGESIDYVNKIGLDIIYEHEQNLINYATEKIKNIDGVTIIGNSKEKAGVLSFVMKGIHPHDIGTFLSEDGIAVRAGHHCAQPVMKRFNIPATTRASFYLYNDYTDVDMLIESILKIKKVFD